MKKLFLFTVALLTSLMVGATTYTLEPGERQIENKLSELVDGDVLELKTGTYTEWSSLIFTTKVTLKAAEGASPKLALYNWKIQNDFEINGVEIKNVSKDNYLFRVYAEVAGTVAFKNCSMQLNEEVTSPVSYINVKEGKTVGSLVVENCLFKPNAKTQGAVIGASGSTTTITNFSMINSTVYNCGNELTVWLEGVVNANVDHCTFYNCGTRVLYLKGNPISTCSISNSVIANPAEATGEVVVPYTGTVSNFVYYNTSEGVNWQATKVNVINANPLFADPANGDFNFAFTSPLFLAATDGTHIGDPRWGVAEPETAIAVPDTLPAMQAVLSGTKISASENGIAWNDNSANPNDNSASWVIDVAKAGNYEVVIYEASGSGHSFMACVANNETWLDTITEKSSTNWTHNADITIGAFTFAASGKYLVRLMNGMEYSSGIAKYCIMNYAGGAVVDIPGTLPVTDAILSSGASVNEAGYIAYASATQDNARWNINATKAGSMSVTMDVVTTNGHTYMVALYSMEGDSITAVKEHGWTDANGTMSLEGTIDIPQAGNYYVVVKNTVSGSPAVYKDVTFTYTGGGVVTIPGTLSPADAMLSEKAFIDNDTIIFAPRGAEGYTPDGWAKWNVTLEDDALCSFKANCHKFSSNSMKIKISVINSENDTIYQKEENVENSGDSEVALGNIMLATGDYVIQMQNTVKHSKGRLMSVVVESSPVLVITDDSDIDFTDYAGQTVNVQLIRTFKANMWNPICLPFGVSHSVLQSILKCETSYLLKSSSLEGQKLYVELEASQYNDIYNGSPYMIKPSEDVVNPLFTNVTIMETPHATSSEKGVLRLQGSFASHAIDNPQNALLVGANNTLFFPNDETPYIKSMRAYFILQGVSPANMPKSACFREPGNAPTWMEVQNAECTMHNGKFIRNGRFVIVREGKEYNALGVGR